MRNRSASFRARERLYARGPLKNLRELVQTAGELYGDQIAFSEARGAGTCITYTYRQLMDDVNALGTALLAHGLRGKHIALLGENSYRWVVSYLAVICGCGVVVPMDKELTPQGLGQLVRTSNAELLLCSKAYLKTARILMQENAALRGACLMEGSAEPDVYSLDTLMEQGRAMLQAGDRSYLEQPIDSDALAALLFTSGTTGANKGVMLSHKNICATINAIVEIIPYEFVSFSVLPMNHAFEFNCHILPGIYCGVKICINSSLKRLMSNINTFKPGMMVVVPLFLDEIYASIWKSAKKNRKEGLLKAAIWISRALRCVGIDLRRLMFRQIHEGLGGNLSLVVCGGAQMNASVAKGLSDFGIDIINGYGITECSPLVTVNLKTDRKPHLVGEPVPGVEVKIAEADRNGVGEVLVRGENVMLGYYHDEASNQVSFSDGWFRTGDYGKLDSKGRLQLAGRKKNLIILENGKNVHPEEIEATIQENLHYVRDVVVHEAYSDVHGQICHGIAATISLEPDSEQALEDEAARNRSVTEDIRRLNRQLAPYKRIYLLEVTLEEFEKTTTRKVVRQSVTGVKQRHYLVV